MHYKFWGKSDGERYHLLVYHGVDTCSITRAWIDRNESMIQTLADDVLLRTKTLRGLLLFFSALHDIGKFSITFQNLCPKLLKVLQGRQSTKDYGIRHDQLGWMLWDKHLRSRLIERLEPVESSNRHWENRITKLLDVFARIAFGHHGLPPVTDVSLFHSCFLPSDLEAAERYMDDLLSMFLPEESLERISNWAEQPKEQNKLALFRLKSRSWQLAGMIVISDWLASGASFPFDDEQRPIAEYYQSVLPVAVDALRKAGLYTSSSAASVGFGYLFPDYADSPTPLQDFCDKVDLTSGPQLWILEDVTGAGKTEAACTLVSRMMKEGLATGAFVALPTMATSNAMYERMAGVYHLFFSSDCRPSLVLSHGARHLSDTFRQSYSDIKSDANRDCDHDTFASCSEWLADSRKKSLLADIGIGTLDQVLLGALPVRYQSLRALGMSSKVLVVDEIHAYEPYMLQILEKIVAHHAYLGVPVILLSATIPHAIFKRLCQAFYRGLGVESSRSTIPSNSSGEHFPLVTKVDSEGIHSSAVQTRKESIRTIPVAFLDSRKKVYERILDAHRNGQCVCWIRNTIKDIVKAYNELKDLLPSDSLSVFHSRFSLSDRLEIERRVLETYDKSSTGMRRAGQVLLASQVVEQSLDLDFDVLISDLAPIDLVIQRVGRLHRHLRNAAGDRVCRASEATRESPTFYVHAPPEPETPSADWFSDSFRDASYVYHDTAMLWRTKEILRREKRISLPADARALVEAVYGEDRLEVPKVFFEAEDIAFGRGAASRDHADFNTINFEKGYARDNQHWDSEERIPTREGDQQRVVYLARFHAGKLSPYVDEDFGWDLSMIKMRAASIPGEIDYPPEIEEAIDSFRRSRRIDNDALILVVQGEPMRWTLDDPDRGRSMTIHYDFTLGLQTDTEQ